MDDVCKIPLRNLNGDIVDYAIVSTEDFDKVNKRKWSKQIKSENLFYALSNQNNNPIRMHQFIMGKAPKGLIISHINGNGLDNRRENLSFATQSQNMQNTDKRENTTSKFKGVSYNSRLKKWRMQFGRNEWYEYHTCEEDAAKRYDIYVLLKFGKDARTNGLINFDGIKDLSIDEEFKKKEKELPIGITFRKDNKKYVVDIKNNNIRYIKSHSSLDEAIKDLNYQRNLIKLSKESETKVHFEKEIIRNCESQAIIKIKDLEVFVDDDLWHELTQYSWNIINDYISTEINKKRVSMHEYVMNKYNLIPGENEIIDHINKIKHDNRKINLRINSRSGNSHNKKKAPGAASKYYGVSRNGKNWGVRIIFKGITYHCGTFKKELEAAKAYNNKAIELYGEFANLNDLTT